MIGIILGTLFCGVIAELAGLMAAEFDASGESPRNLLIVWSVLVALIIVIISAMAVGEYIFVHDIGFWLPN